LSEVLRWLRGRMVVVHCDCVEARGRLIYHQDSCHAPNHQPEVLVLQNGENLTILRGWEKIQILSRLET